VSEAFGALASVPPDWHLKVRSGDTRTVGYGVATAVPTFDFETASAAGYEWDGKKWVAPKGAAKNKKGLKVVGRRNYIHHPSFRVLSLSYDLLDGKGLRFWYPNQYTAPIALTDCNPATRNPHAHPWELLDHVAAGNTVEAWNSGFEFDVWNEYCVPTWGWPMLALEQTRCAASKARAHAMPGKLERFGDVANLSVKKDKDGERLLNKFSVPQKPTKKQPNFWIQPHEDPQDFARLLSYNGTDVLSEVEASLRTPDLSADELQIWLADQRVNLRGIHVDTVALENCIAVVEQAYEKYNAELVALTGGAVGAASEVKKLAAWLSTRGVTMHGMDEDAVDAMLERMKKGGSKGTVEYRVLEIRSLLGSASIKKLFAIRHQTHRGRLYDLYTFFGARTGRWTGNGPQPQNLPSGLFHSLAEVERALGVISHRCLELVEHFYPNNSALEIVASCLRGLLVAAPGYELVCSDYSAIEGVVTAALAGEEWRLEIFRTHGMIYEASAAAISGISFDEFVKHRLDTGGKATWVDGKLMGIEGGKHHPLRKKLGKFAELGSGFGGWIPAWCNFGADEFLTEAEIKKGILAWRAASPNIVEFWGGQSRGRFRDAYPELFGLEGAAIAAVKWPGQPFSPATNTGITYQMSVQDDILYCRVPSGGFLTYHRPRLEPSTRDHANTWELQLSYEGDNKNPKMGRTGWVRMGLYGGKQCENIVQKEARFIQAHALVNLDRRGYRPVIHSHDEIAGEVPVGWGSVEEFEAIASALPACCVSHRGASKGRPWPVRMKGGWRYPRYGKFEE
jgi:DNA polymerase